MKNSNDIFTANIAEIGRKIVKNSKPGEKENYMYELISVLFFATAQAVFVIFRYNFGKNGISLPKLITAFIFLIVISAILLYNFYHPENINVIYGSLQSYFITAIVLMALATFFLVKGILHIINAKNDSDYSGNSYLAKFMAKGKQKLVQLFIEPFFMLLIGGAYCFYNLWGGIVIAFCGLSVWGSIAVEYYYLGNRIQNNLNSQSSKQDNNITTVS